MKALLIRAVEREDGQDLIELPAPDWRHHRRQHACHVGDRREDHAVLHEPERCHALRDDTSGPDE